MPHLFAISIDPQGDLGPLRGTGAKLGSYISIIWNGINHTDTLVEDANAYKGADEKRDAFFRQITASMVGRGRKPDAVAESLPGLVLVFDEDYIANIPKDQDTGAIVADGIEAYRSGAAGAEQLMQTLRRAFRGALDRDYTRIPPIAARKPDDVQPAP